MKKIFYLFIFLLLSACSPDEGSSTSIDAEVETQQFNLTSPELRSDEGDLVEIEYRGSIITVEDLGDRYLFQGDIYLPKEDKGLNKSAIRFSDYWWKDNTVIYSINPNLPNKQRIYDAIAHYESNTYLKFVERNFTNNDYIYFTTGNGCSSYVGFIGGRQNITLSDGCSTGNTIHEIGHALGFWHEHTRADRDEYVKVLFENIESGREHNFQKYTSTGWGGIDGTPELDFNSIMMYGSYSFSSNGKPTITKLNGNTFYVQRNGLSEGDLYTLNEIMYPDPNAPVDTDGDGIIDSEDKCPNEAGVAEYDGCPIPDTDGDGILDNVDECPTVAGVAAYNGCPIPDTDGDGILDPDDECPNEVGVPEYNGCPIPDTDGDGILDPDDKCPNEFGLVEYEGCPIPDRDGDGVPDEEDECPDEAGSPLTYGCPIERTNGQYVSGTYYEVLNETVYYLHGYFYLLKDNVWYRAFIENGNKWKLHPINDSERTRNPPWRN